MTMPRILTTVCAAGLAGCAALGGGALAPVTESALQAHVRFLASDALEGRMTGSAGYEIAAQYVESQFRQIGLAPGNGASYRQDVPYASALIDAEASAVTLHRGGKARRLKWREEFTASGDPLKKQTQVRAKAVFAGYGIDAPDQNHNDYANLDVRGKIVVVMFGAPKRFPANQRAHYSQNELKRKTAAARGAAGVVGIRNDYFSRQYAWDKWVENAGMVPSMYWLTASGAAADHYPELRGSAALSETAAALLFEGARRSHAQLMAADAAGEPVEPFALPVEIEIARRNSVARVVAPNVIGLLKGSDPRLAAEYVVYMAHLDHDGVGRPVNGDRIYNGMYDNAMGTALLIETARALSAARPKRSILFIAVGGEERGLLGSDYFAEQPTVPIGGIVGNISLDMSLFLYPLADVIAFGAEHSSIGPAVAAAAQAEGWKLSPDPMPDEVIFIRSDHYSLVKQGVPAVFLVSGFTSADPAINGGAEVQKFLQTHYHKPSDDLTRPVHWPSAQKFVRVNARIGLEIANAPQRPRWNDGNFFGELYSRKR